VGHVRTTGQIPVAGERAVNHKSRCGAVFNVSLESPAFSRWQHGHFQNVERNHARGWRDMLSKFDFPSLARGMRALGIDSSVAKTLEDAVALACRVVHRGLKPLDQIQVCSRSSTFPKS
jgi:hypothetical protein